MENDNPSTNLRRVLSRRAPVIAALRDDIDDKRDLTDALDVSRTTVDRAITELEEVGVVNTKGSDFELTLFGNLGFKAHSEFVNTSDDILRVKEVLDGASATENIGLDLVRGAKVYQSNRRAPNEPFRKLHQSASVTNKIEYLTPVIVPELFELLTNKATDQGVEVELLVDNELLGILRVLYEDEYNQVIESDLITVGIASRLPRFGITILDSERVWMNMFNADGGFQGAIINDSPESVAWAQDIYSKYKSRATTLS